MFSCNGCPTVRAAEDGLVALQEAYAGERVRLLAINSNNPFLSPPDTFGEMVKRAEAKRFNFPYVKDEDGSVARRFGAARTPRGVRASTGNDDCAIEGGSPTRATRRR